MSQGLRYHPCVEQRALADTFNQSLKASLTLERLRDAHEESAQTWRQLSELGLFAIGLDADAGGSGLGATEEALIVMELGQRLASPSIIASVGAAHADVPGGSGGWRVRAAYRQGERAVIVGDEQADAIVLRDGESARIHPLPAALETADATLWGASLRTGVIDSAPLSGFSAEGVLRLRLIDAAALAGIARAALDMGVAYAGERRQFGRAIGSFQAVKHHCANMAIAASNARDQVGFAAVAIDQQREDAALQVDCALSVAGAAALANAAKNIQIHGGIGFSEEALPHVPLKRAQLLLAIAGGLEAANARIADACAAAAQSRRQS